MNRHRETLMKFISAQNQKLQDDISKQGYKDNSPYRNNPFNIIQGTSQGTPITMDDVSQRLYATDGKTSKILEPNSGEHFFSGPSVKEIALAKYGGLLNKTIKCSNCGWSWKAADGGNDVGTCHKCGTNNKIMQQGGYTVGNKVIYGTPEYTEAYNRGEVITKEGVRSPIALDEVVIQNNYKRPRGFWEQYRDKIVEENKDASLLGAILGVPISAITSVPQLMGMKALTGKMQRPSEGLEIKNPYGAMAVDAVTDPAAWFGASEVAALKTLTRENALAKLANIRKIKTSASPELRQGLRTAGPSLRSSVDNVTNISKNLEDLNYAKKWAKQYGYELPKNLERIAQSDELTNRTVRGMMNRHNTFVRGVSTNWDELAKKNPEILRHLEGKGIDWQNNPKAAAEYMATHVPIQTGYGRASLNKDVFDQGLDAIYTSNSIPTAEGYTYGQGYITKVKKPTDFSSSNRQDWITQNNPEYYEHNIPKTYSREVLDSRKGWQGSDPYGRFNEFTLGSKENVTKVHSWLDDVAAKDLELRNKYGLSSKELGDYHMTNEITYDHPDFQKLRNEKVENVNNYRDEINAFYTKSQEEAWKKLTPIDKVKFEKSLLKTEHTVPEELKNIIEHPSTFAKLTDQYPELKVVLNKELNNDEVYNQLKLKNPGYSSSSKEVSNYINNKIVEIIRNKKVKGLDFDTLINNKYAHYLHLGTPGEKILEPIKSWEITPDIWKNKSRAHTNTYSKKLSAMEEGGLAKYQNAGPVKKWLGNTLTPEGYITSTTKGGNYTSFTGNDRADDWINKQIDSGKFGFDPKTMSTFPLKKPVKGLSKEDQFIGSEEYYNLRAPEGFADESQRAQIKNLPEWQQDVVNAENEKRRKSYVYNSMKDVVKHPLFSPGYFTPEGVIIGSMQAGLHSGLDLYEGNYKGAAINAGIAALPFLPKIVNTKILPFGKRTLPEELTASYVPPRAKIEGVNDLFGESSLGEVVLQDAKGHNYGYLTMTKGDVGNTANVGMIQVDDALRGHKAQDALYQKAIQQAQEMGYPGLRSGESLQLPEVTRKAHGRFNYVDEGLRGNTDVSVKTLTSHKNENIIPEWEQYYKTIRKPRENISINEAVNKVFPKRSTENINLRLSGSGETPATSVPAIFERDALFAEQELARANADAAAFSNSPFNKQKLQEFRPNQEFTVSNQQARFIGDPVLDREYQAFRNKGNLDYPESLTEQLGRSNGDYLANDYGDLNDIITIKKTTYPGGNVPSNTAYLDAMHETTHSRSLRLRATPQEEKIASEAWEPMIKTNNFGMPAEEAFAVQNELRASLGDIKGNRVYTEKDIPEIKTKLQNLINTGHDYLKGVNVEEFNMPALIKSLNKIGIGAAVPVTIGAGLLDQKKYGGLTKYQFKGEVKDEREGMMKTRDNVPTFRNDFELQLKRQAALEKVQRQKQREAVKTFKALPKKEQERILYEQYAQEHGEIKQYTPDSKLSKFVQSMALPMTALKDLYHKGEVRDNLIRSVINNPTATENNPLDAAYLGALAYLAAPAVASGVGSVATAAAPYVAADAVVPYLGTTLTGVNLGNIATAGFATHGAMNIAPDVAQWADRPSWDNAENIFWDVAEIAPVVGPASKTIGEGMSAIGKGFNTTGKAILEKAPVLGRDFVASQMMNRQIAKGLPKEPLPQRLSKIDLIDKGTVNVENDFLKHFTKDQYDDFLKRTYARDAKAYDNPMIEFKGYTKPASFFKGIGNNEGALTPLQRTLRDFGINPETIKEGKLFKEKFCAPGSECAKSANAVTNRTFTDITANPFNVEQNAHNAWHLEDQMTRHGGQEVANFELKVGDRVLMGNNVNQSTYVPGYTADPSVRHAGMYAGLHEDELGNILPLIFESGKNNAMYLNPVNYNFTGSGSAIKAIRPQQFIGPEFGEALVDKNIRYAFRDKPSVAKFSSENQEVQKVLTEAEKHREVIKKSHDITNDEFDELLNSLVGIGVQETKLNSALPGSTLAKAKIELQNVLTKVGLTKPIKQTINTAKKIANNVKSIDTVLPKYPGASVVEMEAAKLSNSSGVSFQEALAQVKSNYQPPQRFTLSTPTPSKGMFRQKFQTELDRVSGLGTNIKGSNSVENGLGQMAVNYANVKKLYPHATPRQLMDLTTLMWNSPGKARNAELVDFYLFGKNNPDVSRFNFDYIKKINEAKDKYINVHPQGQQEPLFQLFRKNDYPEIQYEKGGKI